MLLSAQCIDIDHLFSRPIYDPKRNGFKTHFLHKNWKLLTFVAFLLLLL